MTSHWRISFTLFFSQLSSFLSYAKYIFVVSIGYDPGQVDPEQIRVPSVEDLCIDLFGEG